jgi:hypothetical protein
VTFRCGGRAEQLEVARMGNAQSPLDVGLYSFRQESDSRRSLGAHGKAKRSVSSDPRGRILRTASPAARGSGLVQAGGRNQGVYIWGILGNFGSAGSMCAHGCALEV